MAVDGQLLLKGEINRCDGGVKANAINNDPCRRFLSMLLFIY